MVLEGEMEFNVNGTIKRLREGESIDFPPQTVHTFANAGDTKCKWVNIHSPKGFLSFFEDLGVSEEEPGAMEKSISAEKIDQVVKKAADYDMHIKNT